MEFRQAPVCSVLAPVVVLAVGVVDRESVLLAVREH
jgi:hypothetical protein